MLAPWKKSYDQPRQHIKKQRHYFANQGPSSQSYGFSSSHVWMWELNHKKGWAQKNWCFWTVVSEKTLESPSDCKEIQPVYPKVDQSWIFIGRTDAKGEAPILWPADAKNWLTGINHNAIKDWREEKKGTTEDEIVGWHHWLNEHAFEQAPGVRNGQGGLACCCSWGHKELDTTEWLNWTNLNPSQNIPKNWTGENNLKIILWCHHCSDTQPVKYKRKLFRQISLRNIYVRILNKILSSWIQQYI